MPIDPYFTSSVKDEDHEERQRRRALAKAYTLKYNIAKLPKSVKQKVLRTSPETRALGTLAVIAKNYPIEVKGGHCLTGFKQPKKMWRHRKY